MTEPLRELERAVRADPSDDVARARLERENRRRSPERERGRAFVQEVFQVLERMEDVERALVAVSFRGGEAFVFRRDEGVIRIADPEAVA